jgi:predicted ArsR family transcriptional regulator
VETVYDSEGQFLGRFAEVFGDPTRRSIYQYVRGAGEPLSASEVASPFGLHRTVARAHLEKLAGAGLLEIGTRRRAKGGRPAKTYAPVSSRVEVMLPPRRYERLSRLLLRLVGDSMEPAAAEAAAVSLGRAYGEEAALDLAGEGVAPPVRLTPQALAGWLNAGGYGVRLGDGAPGLLVVEVTNCVYHELAAEYPKVVCGFDRGMLCGLLGAGDGEHRQTHDISLGDDYCRHEFRL